MNILKTENVTKKFNGLVAVKDVSVTVEKGSITGLIGPNGAGKTTFFNCISGYYNPSGGTVTLEEKEVTNSTPFQMCKKGVARTFQIVKPFGKLTALQNVMVGAYNGTKNWHEARKTAMECLNFVGLAGRRDTVASDITIGEQRILEMARALATRPRLLLLDEVMAGLTPTEIESVKTVVSHIRASGITILMIEHIMAALMSLSDRVIVLNQGELLAEGTPAEVTANPAVIESYLGGEAAC